MSTGRLLVIAVLAGGACAGCSRVTDDMARQPRTDVGAASPLFADNQAARPPVAGTVARSTGDLAWMSGGRTVERPEPEDGAQPTANPAAEQVRGQARYEIYCLPCHGAHGAGDGEVVKRGFPAPAPFGSAALRAVPDARLHDVIRQGTGLMYPFADRVSAADAWAIVAYIRALQRDTPMQTAQASQGAAR